MAISQKRRLQYLITHSFYGKALAVKRVISNKGKNTPGIDGKLWKTENINGCNYNIAN